MKVLFLSRSDLYNPRGGDTYQMEKTKSAIEKIASDISIDISTEINPINIKSYDIVHIFNLDWVCETFPQLKYAKKHKKKVILSAIHHSEIEVKKYEKLARFDIRRIYNFIISSQEMRDMWKNLYRSIFTPQKLIPTINQMRMGIRNQQKTILKESDVVLVQTAIEGKNLQEDFGVLPQKVVKVVNGVDSEVFANARSTPFVDLVKRLKSQDLSNSKIILNVGRIEPRKNQLILFDIFDKLKKLPEFKDYKMVFIGEMSPRSVEYKLRFLHKCKNRNDIIYLGKQPQSLVASAMSHKGIYVHPSWFETTGLVCLESLLAGMPVVTTSTRLSEYVDQGIYYCNPESLISIQDAILKCVSDNPNLSFIQNNIKDNFSWENAADQTISVYRELIK